MPSPSLPDIPADIEGFAELRALALDLRWSWNHSADELWGRIDPELWALTHNPWVVLQTASRTRLTALLSDPAVRRQIDDLIRHRVERLDAPAWFQRAHTPDALGAVAYFSMEFMLSEALPIYSGGLGNVAGDHLKAASDLGVPIVGVGLLYQQGYFRQVIGPDGSQRALHPFNDPMQLPITPVRGPDGEWLRIELAMPGRRIWLRAWQAEVGRTRLYLLDSNDPANDPVERGITSELYGGGPEVRLAQELLLGVGGWRLLERLGVGVEVCHLNEGHAAFVVLDRARSFMAAHGCGFHEALAVTRAGNIFTTHTPVAAGFDRFEPALIKRYLGWVAESVLQIGVEELLALGRADPADGAEPFSMAHLAMRGSAAVNGVSRLHGQVSRRIFQPLFPRWPQAEVPVGHVTNGVHMPSWDSKEADELWTRLCGADRWRGTMEQVTRDFRAASDVALLQIRSAARLALVHYARERLAKQLAAEGAGPAEITQAQRVLDPNALTIGFARRFTTYKRPNLLLHDPDRLARILANPRQPVQLIIAGKAHPRDEAGQAMVKAWVEFIRDRAQVRAHAVFLSDYDMLLSECLVQGVDLWINTPRRPWEASGTSGMKVLVNGGLNLSELDGWWAEAYGPDVGWALGDGLEHGDDPAWDAEEAKALYDILEQDVIPAFYTRDAQGVPAAWVARMRESMARLTPQFSSNRSVREYTEDYYIPSAARYRRRAAQGALSGEEMVQWQRELARHWHNLHFGNLDVETSEGQHLFRVQVYLDELEPQMLQVELFADPWGDAPMFRQPMTREAPLPGAVQGYIYAARVPAARPAEHFVPRIVPHHAEALVPLEAAWILWRS